MSALILERQHFTVSQDNRYFDPANLAAKIRQVVIFILIRTLSCH